MPEGRVVNNGGTLTQEFVITDQQGNARLSFQDRGNGTPIVKQESSYYGFGLIMANSPVAPPAVPNKQLYNGGSEWQNDYTNLPDYYQTFNRNYDAALGRFVGVDPMAEGAESMTGYQYSGNNPVMFNDPLGDLYKTPALSGGVPTTGNVLSGMQNTGPSLIDGDPNIAGGGGGDQGVYGSDPALALYLAITEGTNVYHKGNGTDDDPVIGSIGAGISAIYNMTGQMLGSAADVNYTPTASGGISYSYSTVTPTAAENGVNPGANFTLYSGIIAAGDDHGGWPFTAKSDPVSRIFRTDRTNENVQSAGVTGIEFSRHDIRYNISSDVLTIVAIHIRLPTLYFEYPRITSIFGITNEVIDASWAALVMARATDRAINQLTDWVDSQENLTEWGTKIQFMKYLEG